MPKFRQDLVHAQSESVPEDECSKRISSRLSFRGYVQEVAKSGSNTLTVPITLYGLEGAGKSSVLGTWTCAGRHSPYSFMAEEQESVYANRVKLPSMRATVENTVVIDACMDSRDELDKEGNKLYADMYDDISKFDKCKFEFNDSAPAVSMYKDEYGKKLPFGLLLLVVSARRVEEAITSSENKWSDLVSDDASYPPTACIIAGINNVENSTSTPELLKETFSNITGVKNVVTMPTFPVPTQEEVNKYIRAEADSQLRADYNKEWKETGRSSLEALGEVLEFVKQHESSKIRDVLDEEADWNNYLSTVKRRVSLGAVAVTSVAVAGAAAYMSTVEEE